MLHMTYDRKNVIDAEDSAQFNKRYHGRTEPPKKGPAKFPGRKGTHHLAAHHTPATARKSEV